MEEITEKQIEELKKSSPEMENFVKRINIIETIKKEAEKEEDQESRSDLFQIALNRTEKLSVDVIEYVGQKHTDTFNRLMNDADILQKSIKEYKEMCQMLTDKILEERKENEEFYGMIFMGMLENPRLAFQTLLDTLERNEKINDASGQSWERTLKFGFRARIRMAYKLIFG